MDHETSTQDAYKNWPFAVLIGIDQLGNAIAGGNPDSTISARVGYFSAKSVHTKFFKKHYCKNLERIIDWTFYPLDGPNHCLNAYLADSNEYFRRGNDFVRFLLAIIIYITCPFIAILLRIFVLFKPSWRNI